MSVPPIRLALGGSRYEKSPLLTEGGTGCYHIHKGTPLQRRSALNHQQKLLMLTAWMSAERSARFLGEYVGQKDQAYYKPQKLLSEVAHSQHLPSKGKWPTTECNGALAQSLSYPVIACQSQAVAGKSRPSEIIGEPAFRLLCFSACGKVLP